MKARKYTRYPTDAPISLVINTMMGHHQLYLNDASQGGVSFNAHGCIKQGTPLKVSITENDTPSDVVFSGEVAWCKQSNSGLCQLGVKFQKLMTQAAIEKIVLKH